MTAVESIVNLIGALVQAIGKEKTSSWRSFDFSLLVEIPLLSNFLCSTLLCAPRRTNSIKYVDNTQY